MQSPAKILRLTATAIFVVVLVPVVGEFFVKLAEEGGLYDKPTDRLGKGVAMISAVTSQPWFWYTFTAAASFFAGVWLDWLARRFERRRKPVRIDPSKEELYDLHIRAEALKEGLAADAALGQVNFERFNDVFAVTVRLLRAEIAAPLHPGQSRIKYEDFNNVMYDYFSAMSPFLRDGDIKIIRLWAKHTIAGIKEKKNQSSLLANLGATPARQSLSSTEGKTRP